MLCLPLWGIFLLGLLSCSGCGEFSNQPTQKPDELVTKQMKEAQTLLDAGKDDEAIDALAKAVAVERATNHLEAREFLKRTLTERANAALKKQLEEFTPNLDPLKTGFVLPQADWNAERLVQEYLVAPTWVRQLPFLTDGERVKALMLAAMTYQQQLKLDFLPVVREPQAVGESVVVEVNLPTAAQKPYVVVKTAEGLRIDLPESEKLWAERQEQAFIKAHELENSHLEISLFDMRYDEDLLRLSFHFENESEVKITDMELVVEMYASDGKLVSTFSFTKKSWFDDSLSRRQSRWLYKDIELKGLKPTDKFHFRYNLKALKFQDDEANALWDALKYFQLRVLPDRSFR